MTDRPRKNILAVASAGGHWVQLCRLRPAFTGHTVTYISTNSGYRNEVDDPFYVVTDASMWQKLKLIKMFAEIAWLVLKIRPDVVVTTGAAPGFASVVFGRLFGARTLWIDSIANSEELSGSGKKVRFWASAWVTQWQHLATEKGPDFWGAVL